MKIGVCALHEKIPLLSELGFDYLEGHFSWLAGLDEETFREKTALLERYGLAAEAFNGFFAGDVALYGRGGDPAAQDAILRSIAAYAERGCARAALWGGKVAVVGSGKARNLPDGMSREEGEAQFARVLAVCGEAAERHGMRIAVEPLSRNETNFIHTVAEGADAARRSGHPAVGVLVDFFHHWNNGDELAALPAAGDCLIHAHLARPAPDRNAPQAEDEAALRIYAETLAKCRGVERISLECVWMPDFDTALRDVRPMMEIFREI